MPPLVEEVRAMAGGAVCPGCWRLALPITNPLLLAIVDGKPTCDHVCPSTMRESVRWWAWERRDEFREFLSELAGLRGTPTSALDDQYQGSFPAHLRKSPFGQALGEYLLLSDRHKWLDSIQP